jgi:hypothetical protein
MLPSLFNSKFNRKLLKLIVLPVYLLIPCQLYNFLMLRSYAVLLAERLLLAYKRLDNVKQV